MSKTTRTISLVALAMAALSTTACTSVFPVGTFGWGHGAVPLKEGGVRVQAGGGGGAGLAMTVVPVAGGGGGAAIEYQANKALLLRIDGGAAVQAPGLSLGSSNYDYTVLGAGYLGSQITMSKDQTLALRLRVGGGVEHSPASGGMPESSVPYGGAEAKVVKSFVIDDKLETWIDAGFGVKVPLFTTVRLFGGGTDYSLPLVPDFGGSIGAAWRVGDAGHVYASAQAGAVVLLLPAPVGSLQVGYTHTF